MNSKKRKIKTKVKLKRQIISEFVGLKSRMYSLVSGDGQENKSEKIVNKNVVESTGHKEFDDDLTKK